MLQKTDFRHLMLNVIDIVKNSTEKNGCVNLFENDEIFNGRSASEKEKFLAKFDTIIDICDSLKHQFTDMCDELDSMESESDLQRAVEASYRDADN